MTTKREFLKASLMLGLATSAGASNAQIGPPTAKRRTYVLVHGAAHGGWCWNKTIEPLRSAGHQVFTPTMTGLGERKHLLTKDVDIYTHCQDLINVLEYEELTDVILVCHSYGGLVTTLVADRIPNRIAQLIYLDAQVPRNGETWSSLNSPDVVTNRINAAQEYTKSKNLTVPVMQFSSPFDTAKFLGVTDPADAAWVNRLVTDHPLVTYTQPVKLTNPPGNGIKRAYVDCTGLTLRVFDSVKARIRDEAGWDYMTLSTGHNLMVSAPRETTEILLRYA